MPDTDTRSLDARVAEKVNTHDFGAGDLQYIGGKCVRAHWLRRLLAWCLRRPAPPCKITYTFKYVG